VLPLIEVYIRTTRLAAPLIKEKMDLAVSSEEIELVCSLLSSATKQRIQQSETLKELIVLLLCPPDPLTNSKISLQGFVQSHLLFHQDFAPENSQER